MAIKLSVLAEDLNSSVSELKKMLKQYDFAWNVEDESVDPDIAELLEQELGTNKSSVDEVVDKVEINLEREIVKSQRKQVAGKSNVTNSNKQSATLKTDFLEMADSISVKELSEKTGINAAKLIGELMKNGIISNINQQLDYETVALIMSEFGIVVKRLAQTSSTSELLSQDISQIMGEDDTEDLESRPPIITIMGHVDHGKTKLLDTIRNANVVASESGGITQHIAAYQIKHKEKKITFLDTPGHEAFTEMRSRGAKLTDIAILVVSAAEGVKPTTIEAINHAKEAKVPLIVAINKMDLDTANPDKVKSELAEYEVLPEDWGGEVPMVPISALTGMGVEDLLDTIVLLSDVNQYKANPKRPPVCTVVETHVAPGLGPVATIVVNAGTLELGQPFVVGDAYGKVKSLLDDKGNKLNSLPPSGAALLAGLSKTPHAGDVLQVTNSDKEARLRAEEIAMHRKNEFLNGANNLLEIVSRIKSGSLKVLKLIVKTDTKGSFDAISQSLAKIKHDEVTTKIIHYGVGAVTQSDIAMATASGAIVISFHTETDPNVQKIAEQRGVEVRNYKIIYELIDDITQFLSGMLEPEEVRIDLGKAEVRQIFFTKRKEMIVGLKITNGLLKKSAKIEVVKDDEVIGVGQLLGLQKGTESVTEIKAPNECGIKFKGNIALEEGMKLQAYEIEIRQRSL
jgi:translation initiation factor IF-2